MSQCDLNNSLLFQAAYLSMLCYNFGVDSFQGKSFHASVDWLRESFEVGKANNSVPSPHQVLHYIVVYIHVYTYIVLVLVKIIIG